MTKYVQNVRNTSQSPTSLSIEALEEIVRNCQRNEERLHELERHTRHERKKAERLLRETYRNLQEVDSQKSSILENKTNNDDSYVDNRKPKQRPAKQFFVSLDNENNENETDHHHHNQSRSSYNTNNENNDEFVNQNKHLLDRVEKLLAGDGTTTSSDVVSSQERQKKIIEKPTTPIEDESDDKSLNTDHKDLSEANQFHSECSIEYDLSAVDHLLSERTPISNQRVKSNIHFKDENQLKEPIDKKQNSSEKRDQLSYEQQHSYIETDRSTSSRPSKTDNEYYPYKTRPASKFPNRDDELADLARRCEDLLARLHSQRTRAAMLESSTHYYDYYRPCSPPHTPAYEPTEPYQHHRSPSPSPSPQLPGPPPLSLQQSLELLRPEFISRSRQRARRIRLLREQREQNAEIERERQKMFLFSCTTCCSNPKIRAVSAPSSSRRRNLAFTVPHERSNSSRVSLTYQEMKHATKKKYDQLPEVNDRRRQNQMDEIRRRNLLRAKLFRARLRQHVVRHGRTNIDESLSIIDA